MSRKSGRTLGNFWADLVRSTLYILLPLSVIFAVVLVAQGVVQTFSPYVNATTLQGHVTQIPLGPAASQIAIKQLGTNGGGFFGVNSAHPFENPTPLTNFLEMLAILLLPSALVDTYGRMVGKRRQGWAILAAMYLLFIAGLAVALWAEYQPNPLTPGLANMEGKETRFGVANSVLWATATTDASNGSVNCMHDSLSPLAGMVAMGNIMLGEVVFGGVGAGLYGMLMYVLLTVFMAGLMVGRSPEYLGKRVEKGEVIWAMVATLSPFAVLLVFSAIAVRDQHGLVEPEQCRAARFERNSLRLRLDVEQQRQCLRRTEWQHEFLQSHRGARDVDRALRRHHSRAGHRGKHGPQKNRRPLRRNLSHRQPAVCRHAGRRSWWW